MKTYKLNIEDKKQLVDRLGELTGIKPEYSYMPRCAYKCGSFWVERNGDLTAEDGADMNIVATLLNEGMITGEMPETAGEAMGTEEASETGEAAETTEAEETTETETETEATEETMQETMEEHSVESTDTEEESAEAGDEPTGITISLPMSGHSVDSLRRLINLLYSRGRLLSKASGGAFGADRELIRTLDEAGVVKMEDLIRLTKEHGGLTGLTFDDGKVNFTGFPMAENPDRTKAFMELASLMNRHAITMKRIQAKEVNDENEKYAFRIWLIRIGMNTDEYKTSRKVLMENLSGHTAFRTKAEEEKWKARQKEKRDALKAAKAEAQAAETAEGTADDGENGNSEEAAEA